MKRMVKVKPKANHKALTIFQAASILPKYSPQPLSSKGNLKTPIILFRLSLFT